MCKAEATITIKQNKQKTERGTFIQWKGDRALSYIMAKRQWFVNILSKAAQKREARNKEPADMQMEKGEKRWIFEIINYVSYHFVLWKL